MEKYIMKALLRHSLVASVLSILMFSAAAAWANDKFLNVQGTLTDSSGTPLTGSQTVTFRLYSDYTGGSAIWTESQTISLSTGLFNVALGSVTTLDALSFNQLYYLGIQVAGDADELAPRQQLGASAYAQGSLGDFNVGNSLVVASSVTANTLSASTITATGGIAVAADLTVGGQNITVGTMTVRGNAFSVGTTTFSVAGGSVTLGGRLNVSASGIKWADGTISTSAATNDNSILTATQTFSGANTFTSSLTASNISIPDGSTITTNGQLHRSTYTFNFASYVTGTNTSISNCNIPGSTITIHLDAAGDVLGTLSGSVSGSNVMYIGAQLDGAFPRNSAAGISAQNVGHGSGNNAVATVPFLWTNISVGTHTLCLAMGTNAGTWNLQEGKLWYAEVLK